MAQRPPHASTPDDSHPTRRPRDRGCDPFVRVELEEPDAALLTTALERLVASGDDPGVVERARGLLAYVHLERQKAQRAARNG